MHNNISQNTFHKEQINQECRAYSVAVMGYKCPVKVREGQSDAWFASLQAHCYFTKKGAGWRRTTLGGCPIHDSTMDDDLDVGIT